MYRDLKQNFSDILDFSNYDKDFKLTSTNEDTLDIKLYDPTNKGELGYLKSEYCLLINEFIHLKCKFYSVSYGDNVKLKAKSVKKSSLKNLS